MEPSHTSSTTSVRELELRARLSASEHRERDLVVRFFPSSRFAASRLTTFTQDTLTHLVAYLDDPAITNLPSSTTPLPSRFASLLTHLASRIHTLTAQNTQLLPLARPSQQPSTSALRIEQLEAENARMMEELSMGRVAILEEALKTAAGGGGGSRTIIEALEGDCDELVGVVKGLREELEGVKEELRLARLQQSKVAEGKRRESVSTVATTSRRERSRTRERSPRRSRRREDEERRTNGRRSRSPMRSERGLSPERSDRHASTDGRHVDRERSRQPRNGSRYADDASRHSRHAEEPSRQRYANDPARRPRYAEASPPQQHSPRRADDMQRQLSNGHSPPVLKNPLPEKPHRDGGQSFRNAVQQAAENAGLRRPSEPDQKRRRR